MTGIENDIRHPSLFCLWLGADAGTWVISSTWAVSDCQLTQTHPANNDPCSVSEFTSSTGVNSPDSVNKFGVSTCFYHEIMGFSRDDMYQ